MIHSFKHNWNGETGTTMVFAMVSFTVATMFSLTMISAVNNEGQGVELDHDRAQAEKYAEGLLQFGENEVIQAIATYQPLPTPPANDPYLVLEDDRDSMSMTGHWSVHRATMLDENGENIPRPTLNITDPQTGLNIIVEPYVVTADVTFRKAQVHMRRHISLDKMPIFQFLAFFSDDLEINPGPAMELDGRVHTNGDLYISANTVLDIDTHYLRTSGAFHRHRKESPVVGPGTVNIRTSGPSDNMVILPSVVDLYLAGIMSAWGLDSDFTGWDIDGDGQYLSPGELPPFKNSVQALYGGTFMTGEHGVKDVAHPQIQSIQAYDSVYGGVGGDFVEASSGVFSPVQPGTGTHSRGFYHENAELVIIDGIVTDGDGMDITAFMPAGLLTSRSMYDAREGQYITVTEINLSLLGDMDGNPNTLDPSPYYPDNGLVFVQRTDSVPGSPSGVVLSNGQQLNIPHRWNLDEYLSGGDFEGQTPPHGAYTFGSAEAMGLTVVSPAPIYINGDFNTVNKKSSSVITDTVHLLSNNWDFSKTPGNLPSAASTTYNVAMITGNHETLSGQYSGGFENLPRFHEKWSNKTCDIKGSFVNTWRSQVNTGNWSYGGDNYKAPVREWGYDDDFDQSLPPFTPMVINTHAVAWEISN